MRRQVSQNNLSHPSSAAGTEGLDMNLESPGHAHMITAGPPTRPRDRPRPTMAGRPKNLTKNRHDITLKLGFLPVPPPGLPWPKLNAQKDPTGIEGITVLTMTPSSTMTRRPRHGMRGRSSGRLQRGLVAPSHQELISTVRLVRAI